MIVSDADASTFLGITAGDSLLSLIHPGVEKDVVQFLGWNPVRTAYTRYLPKSEAGGGDDYFVGQYGSIPRAGGATEVLALEHKYVLNDSTLTVSEGEDGQFGQRSTAVWTELTKGTHYVIQIDEEEGAGVGKLSRSGTLIRLGSEWPKSRGSVKVIYNAGFTATEFTGDLTGATDYTDASDIRLAVLQALGRQYNQAKMHQVQSTGRPGGLVVSESIDGYSYSLDGAVAQSMMGLGRTLPPEVQERLWKYRRYGGLFV